LAYERKWLGATQIVSAVSSEMPVEHCSADSSIRANGIAAEGITLEADRCARAWQHDPTQAILEVPRLNGGIRPNHLHQGAF
jgi:hypothetical protein